MRWMRRRGDRIRVISGKYAGHTGTVESNVYLRTVDYPDEWHNGFHIWLDSEELVTVRREQVTGAIRRSQLRSLSAMPVGLGHA